jgi:hypothetical protein
MLPALLALLIVVVGIVLVIVGIVFGGQALAAVWAARDSHSWPTTPGRVVRSEIRHNRNANGLPGHRTLIRYEYTIDGEEYEGRELASGAFPYRSARSAERRLKPYPLGAPVIVRYFPGDPELAVLEPGVSLDVLYLPIVSMILLLIAVGLVTWGGWRFFTAVT